MVKKSILRQKREKAKKKRKELKKGVDKLRNNIKGNPKIINIINKLEQRIENLEEIHNLK